MTIKELKKTQHDYGYTNEELIFIFKYFKERYDINYTWWARETSINQKTIYRILYGKTQRTNSKNRNLLTEVARNLIDRLM